jgi:hypothetical protein
MAFMIVGSSEPIYELDMSNKVRTSSHSSSCGTVSLVPLPLTLPRSLQPALSPTQREELARAAQFILHASLDMVDMNMWATPSTYLKVVDRHSEQLVSAYVTPGGLRFLVLHETRNEEGIRAFATEVHELYAKLALNPFYTPGTRIESKDFDARVRACARRHLGWRGE